MLNSASSFPRARLRRYESKAKEAPSELDGQALEEIAQEALLEIDVSSGRKALEYLLRIDEELGLKPSRDAKGDIFLTIDHSSPKAPKLSAALEAWLRQRERLDAGEISQGDYDAWKASAGASDV